MPVDKEQLAQYVTELGLDKDQTEAMVATLLANDKAATQFVGQRLRHSDYTKKTQDIAKEKEQLQAQVTQQVQAYATELEKANGQIARIMTDLENEKISNATANARLAKVKEMYRLGDDDIPAVTDVRNPAGTGNPDPNSRGGGIDIDARLKDFRKEFLKDLRNDMLALPRLDAIIADIRDEHRELTGKKLSRAETIELIDLAEKGNKRVEDVWQEKYDISAKRKEHERASLEKEFREKWDKEQKQRNSEDAIAGVRRTSPQQQTNLSPVLGRKFNEHADPGRAPVADKSPANQPQAPAPGSGPKLSGAERAAAKFIERRSNGIPMGAPPTT